MRTGQRTRISLLSVAFASALLSSASAEEFDIVLQRGRIVDGSGAPWYSADVGIRDGKISAIGKLDGDPAKERIQVGGMVVAPGFVDTDLLSTTPAPFVEAAAAQTPARRLGTAEEIAEAVAFLASDRASFCNGEVWTLSGGWAGS